MRNWSFPKVDEVRTGRLRGDGRISYTIKSSTVAINTSLSKKITRLFHDNVNSQARKIQPDSETLLKIGGPWRGS